MLALLALLPCVTVIVAVIGFRTSGTVAAGAAAIASLALWSAGLFLQPAFDQLVDALIDALLLGLLVAAIVLPGILFIEVSNRAGGPQAINAVMQSLDLRKPQAVILAATGIGVMLESLTGQGVSLLVTIPLLLALTERHRAIGLGLVGMSLMPWGALSVSAHVGASLSGLPLEQLARMIWLVSGPVAAILPVLCILIVGNAKIRDWVYAFSAGAVLAGSIGLASHVIGIEIAGVAGGFAIILLSVASARTRTGLKASLTAPSLRPYAFLTLAVIAQKLIVTPLAAAGFAPVLTTGRVSFSVLISPGIALLATTLLTLLVGRRAKAQPSLWLALASRSWRPMAGVLLFMAAARILVETGAISALAAMLAGLGPYIAIAVVTLLGALSGYATGGGITGNALFMPSAAATGETFDAITLFAALQNSAAGHAAMAALPVAAILLAALPDRQPGDDQTVMRIGLRLCGLFIVVLFTGAALQWVIA